MHQRSLDKLRRLTIAAMLVTHTGLLAWSAYRHSPVVSEVGHLPAGISHWQFGRFDLYRVNPPLVRMVAALPVLMANPATDWKGYSLDPLTRSETSVGIDFVNSNGPRTFWLYTLGRWACIPFSLIGAVVCYLWARDLYGVRSGLAAIALWCFCPNILGNGSLMMPDVPAAALGAGACYTFWCWLRNPSWLGTVSAGVVLGVAELTKTTLIAFFPLWPLLWLIYRLPDWRRIAARVWLRESAMVLLRMLIALYIINLGYGFEGSMQRLGDYRFKSHILTGASADDRKFAPANKFADSWLAFVPVLLPKNYIQGIDAQKVDFERGMRSYLHSQWRDRGWWYFYLYALAIKVSLGTWALVLLATAIAVMPGGRGICLRDEMLVLVPPLVILLLVSSQTGFSIHFRYVLPIFPFLFIWASKAFFLSPLGGKGQSEGEGQASCTNNTSRSRRESRVSVKRTFGVLAAAALTWSIAISLWYYPDSLSYFNEPVGGPEHGHEHLLDSSVAWGQDLLYLKEWYDAHPEARPLNLAVPGFVDPRIAGIDFTPPPPAPAGPGSINPADQASSRPQPGWYAIDVNYLHGSNLLAADGNGGLAVVNHGSWNLEYFYRLRSFAVVGRTIYVFYVPPE